MTVISVSRCMNPGRSTSFVFTSRDLNSTVSASSINARVLFEILRGEVDLESLPGLAG